MAGGEAGTFFEPGGKIVFALEPQLFGNGAQRVVGVEQILFGKFQPQFLQIVHRRNSEFLFEYPQGLFGGALNELRQIGKADIFWIRDFLHEHYSKNIRQIGKADIF